MRVTKQIRKTLRHGWHGRAAATVNWQVFETRVPAWVWTNALKKREDWDQRTIQARRAAVRLLFWEYTNTVYGREAGQVMRRRARFARLINKTTH